MSAIRITKRQRTNKGRRFTVTSASDARRRYIVLRASGRRGGIVWKCSCPRYIFCRERCKHIAAVQGREGGQ